MRESEERETVGVEGSARANQQKKKDFFRHLDQTTTSFFFTNLPDDVIVGDLWKIFQGFGRVGEVFIPKKVDKRGRRFGFVKFKEVSDVEDLSDRLRNVWCGSFKLWVNLSRFSRSDRKDAPQKTSPTRPATSLEDSILGRSYRKVLTAGTPAKTLKVLKVPVNEELCRELQGVWSVRSHMIEM
ncbi:SC35 splicing factor [Trifolium repens]|nr:SC35 splicing factor [Trifolium repens]